MKFSRAMALGAVMMGLAAAPAGASAAAAWDTPTNDGSYTSTSVAGSITASKPESKLWFHDGSWWGVRFDGAAYTIQRLGTDHRTWTPTGPVVDPRPKTRADVLSDGNDLYISSHVFHDAGHDETAVADPKPSTDPKKNGDARLSHFIYSGGKYTPAGTPQPITTHTTETLVIDKDSTGKLWATWTYNLQVWTAHTTGGPDTPWTAPQVVPGSATLDSDDISSLIAFNGQIGVMWSSQIPRDHGTEWFSVHKDGDPDGVWDTKQVPMNGLSSDDHINLKTFEGKVYAAVKTSQSAATEDLMLLLVRGTNGVWEPPYQYGTVGDSNTRAIVELDTQNRTIHMFATCPAAGSAKGGQSGGDICEKESPMSPISFPKGRGTTVIDDPSDIQGINDATSAKQNLNETTGILVAANNDTSNFYWHGYRSLAGASTPPPPTNPEPPPPVVTPDPPSQAPQTFSPYADAYVKSASPTKNYGGLSVQARYDTAATPNSYGGLVKFDLRTVSGTVTSAKLVIHVIDASKAPGAVYGIGNGWAETTVNWANKPAPLTTPLGAFDPKAAAGATETISLTGGVVTGDFCSFWIPGGGTDSFTFASRESGADAPQLVITTA